MRLPNLKPWLWFLLGIVVLGLGVLWLFRGPSGPSFEGHSARTIFYNPEQFSGLQNKHYADRAFRAMGEEGAAYLIERLEEAPSPATIKRLQFFSKLPALIYKQRKEMWQQRAANLLGEIGEQASIAESALEQAKKSQNFVLSGAAEVALIKIRGEPIDGLIERLDLKNLSDEGKWNNDALMIGALGKRGRPAIPHLLSALSHTNNRLQVCALIALGQIGEDPDQCFPAITPLLRSPSVGIRQNAMISLLGFGTNIVRLKDQILPSLSDPDPYVKHGAQRAMDFIAETEATNSNSP